MRTREEIQKDSLPGVNRGMGYNGPEAIFKVGKGILEVLLDIREFLTEE